MRDSTRYINPPDHSTAQTPPKRGNANASTILGEAQPGDGSFDHPAVSAEAFAGLDSFASDPDHDAAVAYPLPQFDVVVGLVGVQLRGSAATRSTAGLDRGDRSHERFESVSVVGVRHRHRHRHRQRQAGPLGQNVDL